MSQIKTAFTAVTRDAGTVAVVDLAGRLTLGEGSAALRRTVEELIEGDRKQILLNFEGVPFMDSAGLGAVVVSSNHAKNRGGLLRIVNMNPRVREVIVLTQLDKIFPFYANEEAALSSFSD